MSSQIDVVIPTFNGCEFISESIESVLNQSAAVLVNVIVVDDCSIDGTFDFVEKKFGHLENFTLIRNEVNSGPAASRNVGIRAGSSAYVALLDHDDVWAKDKLKHQFAVLPDPLEVAYSVTLQKIIVPEGYSAPTWLRDGMLNTSLDGFLPSTLLVTRVTLELVGNFDESMKNGIDDTDWFARARKMGIPCRKVDLPLVERKAHSHNLSRSPDSQKEMFASIRKHLS
ncbi:MAG: glycosyltransferase family 2 protein [Rhodoluna sp.]|nr:glycosyltransferase family 2 protein [Rhodoluna sp.]